MTILKTRSTLQEWKEVETENQVARDLIRAARWVEQVCQGSRAAAFICGVSGVGKTTAIKKGAGQAEAQGIKPIYCNPTNYRDIVDAFAEAKGKRPLIFEEADQVLNSERMLNILKIATDEAGPRVYNDGKQTVKMDAPCLVATNRDMNDDSAFDKSLLEHIRALRSRATPLVITADTLTLWEFSCYLAIVKGSIRNDNKGNGIPVHVQNTAIAWYTSNLWRLNDVSPRRLREIAWNIFRYWDKSEGNWVPGGEAMWEADLQAMVVRPAQENLAPLIPRIFAPERQREVV